MNEPAGSGSPRRAGGQHPPPSSPGPAASPSLFTSQTSQRDTFPAAERGIPPSPDASLLITEGKAQLLLQCNTRRLRRRGGKKTTPGGKERSRASGAHAVPARTAAASPGEAPERSCPPPARAPLPTPERNFAAAGDADGGAAPPPPATNNGPLPHRGAPLSAPPAPSAGPAWVPPAADR